MPTAKRANLTSLVRSTNFTATQLHFRVSENFTGEKRENISATNRFVLSFCRYKGLGLAHIAFVQTNALLALSGIFKFFAKNIAHSFVFIFYSVSKSDMIFAIADSEAETVILSAAESSDSVAFATA